MLEKRTGSVGLVKEAWAGLSVLGALILKLMPPPLTESERWESETGGAGQRLYPISLKRLGLEGWVESFERASDEDQRGSRGLGR